MSSWGLWGLHTAAEYGEDLLAVAPKLKTPAGNLLNRLSGEFNDWLGGQGDWERANGIQDWVNVENFMKEKYPAAHRGLQAGLEEAEALLDGKPLPKYCGDCQVDLDSDGYCDCEEKSKNVINPQPISYETGIDSSEKYGYDPKEIAAGMVLLHSHGRKFRDNFHFQKNLDRLNDIAQKRYQMQRNYENSTSSTDGIRYAQVVEADVAEDLMKLAMPMEDAYDGNWPDNGDVMDHGTRPDKMPNDIPIFPGPWFHGTDVEFQPGDILSGQGGKTNRSDWTFMTDEPGYAGTYGQHIYEVEPLDEGPYPWNGQTGIASNHYVSPRARVIRKIDLDDEDISKLRGAWAAGHFYKKHYPNLFKTPNGWRESHAHKTDMRRGRETVGSRTAMPNPLPQGVHFRYHPELMWSPGVTAHYQGQQIGSLEWYDDDHVMVDLGSRRPGEIDRISVHPDHRGNSVATKMFDFAKQYEPRLHHSEQLTEDGRGWSEYEKSRTAARLAAVNQDLVDRLKGEFHAWRKEQPKGSIFGGGMIGGLNEWPNIEKFLKDKYPAAHRGLGMGYEMAGPLLDGKPMQADYMMSGPLEYSTPQSYETGPDAEAKHGYDPKEIAAAMLLLHNKTDRFRGDMSSEDQARLNDIAQKRHQMQRAYEQRQVTAGRNGDPPPMTFEPFNTMWSNGIMARHAHDGRPLAHLHWYPDGEIETIRVHPEMRGRGVGKAILTHAVMNPETYEAQGGIKPSNHLTPEGRAFANSLGHVPSDEEVTPAEGEHDWAWKAVQNYVPMHVPYNGQNEDEMSHYLEQPWEPPARTASVEDEGWPVWWRNRHRPAGPFDKRWHPNHPEHIPAPWAD